MKKQSSDDYEPLWAQVKRSFVLRDHGRKISETWEPSTELKLTRPKAPSFRLEERSKLKESLAV